MFDNGNFATGVGDEKILRNCARNFGKNIQRLASSLAMFGNVTHEMGWRQAIRPLVNVRESKTDIKSVFVERVYGEKFAGIFASVMGVDRFIGKSKVAILAGKVELVLLEKSTGLGQPIIVATDESFAVFV